MEDKNCLILQINNRKYNTNDGTNNVRNSRETATERHKIKIQSQGKRHTIGKIKTNWLSKNSRYYVPRD